MPARGCRYLNPWVEGMSIQNSGRMNHLSHTGPPPFSPVWQRLPAAPAGRFGYPPWLTLRPARWSFVGPFFAAGHRVRLMRSKRTDEERVERGGGLTAAVAAAMGRVLPPELSKASFKSERRANDRSSAANSTGGC
jgi:hypothetical protein